MAVIAQYAPKQEKLDNTIKLVDTGYYEADNGRVKSEFYETGNEVVFINKGRRISWKPENMKYLDEFGNEDIIYSVQDVPLEVKANYARFNRSMPDVDDWFIQENDRLKHQIIVQGFQRDPNPWLSGNIEFIIGGKMSFDTDLKVVANGIEQTGDFETDGAIHLYDGDTLVFTLPEVVAFDSAYNRNMTFGKYRVTKNIAGSFSFDIVLSNEWVSSLDRVYPIVIDPTVVVSSGYSTSGNGGRKLVRLSNGWLVALVINGTTSANYYVSKDNGSTWSQLCYFSLTAGATYFASIASNGTIVYTIMGGTTGTGLNFYQFDATTVANTNISATSYIDTGQTALQQCSLAINEAGTELHAAWASKNSTYPNSFNIRYAKGTINADGSVTWGGVEQVTTFNTTGYDYKKPTITVKHDGYPIIITEAKDTTNFITSYRFDGTSWVGKVVYDGASYPQSSPSVVFVPQSVNGVADIIGVAWHGRDSTHTTTDYIRFSKSTDGGANWSAMQKLVPGRNASLTADKNGKLYITYEDPADGKIKRIESTDNGDSWSSPYEVDTGTNPSMMFDHTFTSSLVGWVYMSVSSVKFDKIVLNQPPNAPILDTKSNFDATDNAVFSWTYSDPDPSDNQSAYQLEIIDVGTGSTVYDTGKVASTTSSHTLPAGTLVNNKQYQWRVKTWDNSDTEGAWSDYTTFYTSAKPSVTITNLTEGQTIITSSLTVQWSMSDPESEGQSAYQIKLTDMSDTVLYDTGKVIDSVSRSRTLGYELENHTDYKVKISVWDGRDVKSEEQVISIHVSFTPPAEPNVTTTRNNASITINIEHPTPVDPQPTVVYSDIFRRRQGESKWIRIATGVQSSFTDYTPASGVVYEYKVRAWGDNETYTDSAVASESVEFTGVWLHDTTDPSTLHQFKYDGDGRGENWQPTAAMIQFAGRKLPIAEYDDSETRSITVNLKMRKYDTDKEMLEKLIRSKNTLCYRDGRGRKMFCHALQLPISDEVYGNTVSITFEEVSYTEEV